VTEEIESGASVHLPHDPLGAGVDALDEAVVVRQREAGVRGSPVDFEAIGEAAQVGQIDGAGRRGWVRPTTPGSAMMR
jgi:hypothetical protein